MTLNLTCTQVGALLSFYMNDKLNDQLKHFVKAHLDICPTCRAKFDALKDMVTSLRSVHEQISNTVPDKKELAQAHQQRVFKMNLSAYIDNELSDEENIKIKKSIISNPQARNDLERLYKFEKVLHNTLERSKNEVKQDFSKFVLRRIDIQEEVYSSDSFAKIVALFIIVFAIFTISAVIIFWI